MRFKVLRGVLENENGRYSRGDIVETDIDLVKRFNQEGSIKYERILEPAYTPSPQETETAVDVAEPLEEKEDSSEENHGYTRKELEDLKLSEVRELASDLELDLSGVKKSSKKELIAAILKK